MIVQARRIVTAPNNFARVEALVGDGMVDGEWVGVTQFMDYEICKKVLKMFGG